jgi:hypothetical protein
MEKKEIMRMFEEIKRERPDSKYWYFPVTDYHVIHMPRGLKTHGSSVGIACNQTCEALGDIITYDDPEIVESVKRASEELKCKVDEIHRHGYFMPEAHIHIECKGMDMKDVERLMSMVRWF